MKLRRNSWHAKLNTFVFGWGYLESVDCLCPYFWGTLLALLVSPLILLAKGVIRGIEAIPHIDFPKLPSVSRKTRKTLTTIVGYAFLGLLIIILAATIIQAIIDFGIIHVLFWIGVIAGVIGGIVGLVFLISFIIDKYNDWRWDHPKEDRPNLFVEFVKAKKNKHCPLVQWE